MEPCRPVWSRLSPLVGEGGSATRSGGEPDEGSASAERDPSSVSHLSMRATLSHKGRGEVSVALSARPSARLFVISRPHARRAMPLLARNRRV